MGDRGLPPPKVYIAGPMAGLPEFNRATFEAAANILRAFDWTVVSPLELDGQGEHPDTDHENSAVPPHARAWYLRRDLRVLLDCDGVVLLPGWRESRGATVELLVARAAGLKVWEFSWDAEWGQLDALWESDAMPDIALVFCHLQEVGH